MKTTANIIAIGLFVLLCGCVTPQPNAMKAEKCALLKANWPKLQKDMTEDQVAKLLGAFDHMVHTQGAGYSVELAKGTYTSHYEDEFCILLFVDGKLSNWVLRGTTPNVVGGGTTLPRFLP